MITLNHVKLNDIIYYKKAEFDVDYQGITFISGKNKNAKIPRNNGSGKTLLAQSIVGFLYPDILDTKETGKKVKHSLFANKDASIAWDITVGDKNYCIKKYRSGRGIKWDISCGTEDLNPKKLSSVAEDILNEIIPLSNEDFFTYVYLTSRRLSILQNGSSVDRHKYFTNLFRLHDFENIKEYFQDELKTLNSEKVRRDTLVESLKHTSWVTEYNHDVESKKVRKIKNKIKSLDKEIKILQKKQKNYDLYVRYKDDYEKSKDFVQTTIENLEQDLKKAVRYENYLEQREKYNKELKRYNKDVNIVKKYIKFDKNDNIQDLWNKFIVDQSVKYTEYKIEYIRWEKSVNKWNEWEETVKELKKLKKNQVDCMDVSLIDHMISNLSNRIKILNKMEGSTCEICGAPLSHQMVEEIIQDALEKIESLKKDRKVSVAQEKLRKSIDKLKQIRKPDKPGVKPKKPKVINININLACPSKPKKAEKTKSVEKIEKMLKVAKVLEKAANRCEGIPVKILKGVGIKDNSKVINKKLNRILELTQDYTKKENNITEYFKDLKIWKSIDKQIKKIGSNLKNWSLYEALIEAYGNKGLKIFVMRRIADTIIANMNKFSNLLFPEKIQFSYDIDINTFNLYAIRVDDKVSDIRELSGGESTSFCLLWMLSILPLIPESRRTNFIILDEFEAGLDEHTKQFILNEYLPQLQTIVPHIIFLTPYQQNNINGRIFECIKENSISKLKRIA